MRKVQKEQVVGFVELLEDAHKEITKLLNEKQLEAALDMLEQCYQSAIKLGNFIEKEEGIGFVTVGILEKYCEIIYSIHKMVVTTQGWNVSDIEGILLKIFVSIKNSVAEDIKVRKEVVFLPYKVAMWDSLESVWKAANDDPMCDAYVIPIPYYEKNQDGSLGKMVYEGNDYPDYVPIVDFRKYDIEKRRPDVIYIHNPYDNNNLVTSVHPDFYSSRLYELTEKLVYIPYFLADKGVPEDLRVLPGTVYSHKVIISSLKEKEDYIAGFEKWISNKELSGDYELYMPKWREKFEVIGSPKYDKVLAVKRCKENLPKEWLEKIYKEDGTRKKVLFYNTTIKALLENDKILEKIEETITKVKEDKDIVLWWRPHPLYESTIQTSRSELLEKYCEIVNRFRMEENGIFDKTTDLNRAVAEADAYYGDGSSVMYLFMKLGKPILVQKISR